MALSGLHGLLEIQSAPTVTSPEAAFKQSSKKNAPETMSNTELTTSASKVDNAPLTLAEPDNAARSDHELEASLRRWDTMRLR
jgi:hypothetical protein